MDCGKRKAQKGLTVETNMKTVRIIYPAEIALEKLTPRLEPLLVEEQVHLYDVYGIIKGVKQKINKKGDWSCFRGDFEAFCVDSGEVYVSKSLILTNPAHTQLMDVIKPANKSWFGMNISFAARVKLVSPSTAGVLVGFEIDSHLFIDPHDVWENLRSTVVENGGMSALMVTP